MQDILPRVLDIVTDDFPHLVVCLQPSQSPREDVRFEPRYITQQLRTFNLMETILIRQQGFARRLSFSEFLNRYQHLAFDFDEEVELSKENCQLLLIRIKMDGWKMGASKAASASLLLRASSGGSSARPTSLHLPAALLLSWKEGCSFCFDGAPVGVPEVPHGGVPLPAVRDAREEDHQDTGHGPEVHSEGPAGEVRTSYTDALQRDT
ncbi:neither inactivation nor afterpotential protein C [Caerostris darwini]|uniref:Neither inactivation nor afterpotential protein C n=1 Tax=Caerostris darwini TaxID=1538125 RepID=A0AAV4W4U0_9ARAC|nr:neither inactivation nor afterpotential protein C [Caerostris darwini]